MILSIILNSAIVIITIIAILMHKKNTTMKNLLRYFTVQSNVLCAAASLMVVIFRIIGVMPEWVLVLNYVGTTAVMVTLLTVLFFLGPSMGGYKDLLSGGDFYLHLICPLLALISYLMVDRVDVGFIMVLYGILPVILYGLLYLYKVILDAEDRRWEDFYGFNRGGKWPVSMAAMFAGTFLVSLGLWLLGRMIG